MQLSYSDKDNLNAKFEEYSQIYFKNKNNSLGANALYELGLIYWNLGFKYSEIGKNNNYDLQIIYYADEINEKSGMLFVAAADKGYLPAMVKAGHYFYGVKHHRDLNRLTPGMLFSEREKLCEEDERLGFQYTRLAADKGHLPSIKKLMYLYWKGLGVQKDFDQAVNYFDKAKSFGFQFDLIDVTFGYGQVTRELEDYKREKMLNSQLRNQLG